MPTHERIVLTRMELYELVWSKPLRHLAKEFGMSDVALGKWCKKMDIPRPGVGYWQMKEAGKKLRRRRLPDPEREDELHVRVPHYESGELESDSPPPPLPDYEVFENAPENQIVVGEKLLRPHPHVAHARKLLRAGRVDSKYGWIYGWEWPYLEIRVSPGTLDRASRLMDALLKTLTSRGVAVEVEEADDCKEATVAVIDGERIGFGLFESPHKGLVEDAWSKKKVPRMVPSGLFVLRIRGHYGGDVVQIRDQKRRSVEDRLNEFVIRLHREAARRKEVRAQRERQQLEWEEERQRKAKKGGAVSFARSGGRKIPRARVSCQQLAEGSRYTRVSESTSFGTRSIRFRKSGFRIRGVGTVGLLPGRSNRSIDSGYGGG